MINLDTYTVSRSQIMHNEGVWHEKENTIDSLREKFRTDLEAVAPDLRSNNLSQQYTTTLFEKLVHAGAETQDDIKTAGTIEYYRIGRDVLGPLAVSFVDNVLKQSEGNILFPARDATPLFYIAHTLIAQAPDRYPTSAHRLQNPVFNRKLWGVDDEQDPEQEVLKVTDPTVLKLLKQMGFGRDEPVTFIEIGCWGTMIDQLKQAMERAEMPEQSFSVHFLFTHLPEYISGYINKYGTDIPKATLETIADTWEAVPKPFKRPAKLVEIDGIIKASSAGSIVNSPFLKPWSHAVHEGVMDAAKDFLLQGKGVVVKDEILRLLKLSNQAKQGIFTGILPWHTETWSEGDIWKKNWKWGKIPPKT
ncbi:MAG: hypothetical protein HYT10_01075 [Candidatus Levybacteria bacterium]|nr:hypothetical protein [Candidatus Levybacteria bacterium]